MKETRQKYIFYLFSAFLLISMLAVSRHAGINCDEVLHYQQSVSVYSYFASHGKDHSALDTPETHLKYYGQSYDNLTTIIIKWLKIGDVYRFRHIMSTISGWLTILVTALFAIWLTGYRAGIIVLFLFVVSPTFLGHSQNNLKDVPFALGYISGVYYILKTLSTEREIQGNNSGMLALSIAFCISIRAGGLLLICYLFLFFLLFFIDKFLRKREFQFPEIRKRLLLISVISIVAYFLSIILWPYALQNPVKNVFESYRVMAHFPGTFRQIFEGRVEWSDYMPWYYIIKSMAITIPIVVLSGITLFMVFARKIFRSGNPLKYGFLVFTVLFPLAFVIIENSNLYSSWRQFLFLYPGIVLIATIGVGSLFNFVRNRYLTISIIAIMVLFSIHPVRFMAANLPYSYIYYNQFVGGLKGAYGNYETDYYYVSQAEAAEWLISHLENTEKNKAVRVKATYSVQWLFRNHPEIETSYFRYEERSLYNWDYAIVVNRYISPYQLKNNIWPPTNAIHIVYADSVPVCAVLERKSKDDYYGYIALNEGKTKEAVKLYKDALIENRGDEMIFYNFGAALFKDGQTEKADSALKEGLKINPDFEPILMYLGNIAKKENRADEAIRYYEQLINVNRKYFEAYVELEKLMVGKDVLKAREILRRCLLISPRYKPAIIALADSYRNSNPDIAKKYDELADKIK